MSAWTDTTGSRCVREHQRTGPEAAQPVVLDQPQGTVDLGVSRRLVTAQAGHQVPLGKNHGGERERLRPRREVVRVSERQVGAVDVVLEQPGQTDRVHHGGAVGTGRAQSVQRVLRVRA
jgi:hypothetical protein